MNKLLVVGAVLVSAASAWAGPSGNLRGFRDGANHHLGDDSFVARFGRPPDGGDSEALRMRTHLEYVRAELGARPATAPALAARRSQLLGYLDDYIAKGETPLNRHVAGRSPVFIDDDGRICAVGYLIERSVGRGLAERIAASHRNDLLEDIDLPELRAWVAGSGLTLTELASIQPGYLGPDVERWQVWSLPAARPANGPWRLAADGVITTGSWQGGQMEGAWRRTTDAGRLLGEGVFHGGRGEWTSYGVAGQPLASGTFRRSLADGRWQIFHPSGRVAAEGRFTAGQRDGVWHFFDDDPAGTRLATGSFTSGKLSGRWQHFDAHGALLATAWTATPASWRRAGTGFSLRIEADADGITREVHSGDVAGDDQRLDRIRVDGQAFLIQWDSAEPRILDDAGQRLEHGAAGWEAHGCVWSAARQRLARSGSLSRLHGELRDDDTRDGCAARPAGADETARLERALASVRAVRAPMPAFVQRAAAEGDAAERLADSAPPARDPGATPAEIPAPPAADAPVYPFDTARGEGADLAKLLANNMAWYIEWPHINGYFDQLLPGLPDHFRPDGDPERAPGLALR